MQLNSVSFKKRTQKTLFILLYCIFIHCIASHAGTSSIPPKLTVIMIIDQFAYHYVTKLKGYFNYGIKFLLDNGICYHNAHHPHGIPETSPGHASLSTGTVPHEHGISTNQWYNTVGNQTHWVYDSSEKTAEYKNGTTYPWGKSAHQMLADGLSDQVIMLSTTTNPKKVFALSNKDRAAIALASKLGKAIWFDRLSGHYTSSQCYFDSVPQWLTQFNEQKNIPSLTNTTWNLMYEQTNKAYDFPFIDNYDHAGYDFSLVQKKIIPIDHDAKEPYDNFLKTPAADRLLLDLATTCVNQNLTPDSPDTMLLWVSLSSLDLVGHVYGPDSRESIDLLYHLDKALQEFIDPLLNTFGQENVLLVLTADHGIQPIPEITQKRGFSGAKRLNANELINGMNRHIEKLFGINKIVQINEASFFILDQDKMKNCDTAMQKNILYELKKYLEKIPGIKHAWTYNELEKATFPKNSLERFYQNTLSNKIHGDLICMPEPYCLITPYKTGASHNTPYDYNTHVPLVMYQKNRFEKKQCYQRIMIQQLALTLATIMQVPQPSASTYGLLPDLLTTAIQSNQAGN